MFDDCLIVGGGVIGLTIAYELASRGVAVRVVERGATGREASWAGAGILPPGNYRQPADADEQLARLSHELHPRFAEQLREETGIDNGYRRTGGIYLARTAADVESLGVQAEQWGAAGISWEWVDADRLNLLEPAIGGGSASTGSTSAAASPRFTAALLAPDEAQIRNPRHVRALRAACVARGVTLVEGESVEEFEIASGRVQAVRTSRDRMVAGAFCITGGAWSGALLARLGATVPLRPIRGQMALLDTHAPVLRHVINEGKQYLVPRDDGRVLIGSTEEDAGFDKRTTAAAISELLRFGREIMPALDGAQLERTWAGLRPATADGRPYLGRVPGFDNAFVAAGHFRSGLWLSTGTAVVLRQTILGEPTDVDLASFRLDRG